MRAIRLTTLSVVFCVLLPGTAMVGAQDSNARKEMMRAELSGAPGMEVVSSIIEYKTGEVAARHFHQHRYRTAPSMPPTTKPSAPAVV